ncbi:MAG: A/G-specific adenine glycosylase [Desulfovibrionaceae bacterium]
MNTSFSELIIDWFLKNKRDLPWRHSYHPYHVWISEIMLQQTQMTRGVEYFTRWIRRFPNIQSVAEASIEELYTYWEGLGYYSRVRNLHKTAILLVKEYGAELPNNVLLLKSLPGIGDYTAGAIASIAFSIDTVCVDANVIRIITRTHGIFKNSKEKETIEHIKRITHSLLPKGNARLFNQALMELGALLCGKKIQCTQCPLKEQCYAFQHNKTTELPYLPEKKEKKYLENVILIPLHNNAFYIRQRPENTVWATFWEFPEYTVALGKDNFFSCEEDLFFQAQKLFIKEYQESCTKNIYLGNIQYTYTNHNVVAHAFIIDIPIQKLSGTSYKKYSSHFVSKIELHKFVFSSGQRKIMTRL